MLGPFEWPDNLRKVTGDEEGKKEGQIWDQAKISKTSCEKKGVVHKYSHSSIHSNLKSRYHDGYPAEARRSRAQYPLGGSSQCGWPVNRQSQGSGEYHGRSSTAAQRQRERIFHVAWEEGVPQVCPDEEVGEGKEQEGREGIWGVKTARGMNMMVLL